MFRPIGTLGFGREEARDLARSRVTSAPPFGTAMSRGKELRFH
jgi:hypothetical protein